MILSHVSLVGGRTNNPLPRFEAGEGGERSETGEGISCAVTNPTLTRPLRSKGPLPRPLRSAVEGDYAANV
ncbi:MAG: hypothetical protein QOK29_4556 [Rhodospirillaceae bacterium]|nr:hypothetical protein [Rhodospirillaceae bacterium]